MLGPMSRRQRPTTPRSPGQLVEARGLAVALPALKDLIQYMPAGVNNIHATKAGKPTELDVLVDARSADVLQRALQAHLQSDRHRPYFDFDHAGGRASARPTEFFWSESPEPGVYARVQWTKSGAAAVEGGDYGAFSPSFFVDDQTPARVVGAPFDMGGLVNDPAFRRIKPVAAKRAANPDTMNKTKQLAALIRTLSTLQTEIAALRAKEDDPAAQSQADEKLKLVEAKHAEFERITDELRAEEEGAVAGEATLTINDASGAIRAKDSELEALRQDKARLEGEVKATRQREATAAVKTAVERGVLPAQDKAEQEHWRKLIEENPLMAERLLKLPANRLIQAGRVVLPDGAASSIEVVEGDVINALEAYGKAPTAAARAALWRADLRGRVEKGNDLVEAVNTINRRVRSGHYGSVVHADNSLGTLSGTLVVQRSLDFLKYEYPVLTRISSNYSDANAKKGQTIETRLRTGLTARDYVAADGYVDSDATTTDVPVLIDKHKYIQVKFGVEELASTMRGLFAEQEEPMHYALGSALVDDLYALTTNANYGNKTTAALVDFKRTTIVAMGTALSKRKVPKFGRTLLINSDYYGQLAGDDTILALAAQQDRSIITGNKLPPIHGFEIFEAGSLPTTANLTGFGFRPDAWAMATRVPADYTEALAGLPATGLVQVVTNPDTGISVMLVQYVDHKMGVARGRIALMYGVAKAQTDSAQRLVSA